jgi:PAS domain S-box-containing protein
MRLKTLLEENRALMDATTEVAFISTNEEGIIEDINIGVEKLLGYTSDQVNGQSMIDLLFLHKEWEETSNALVKNRSGKLETRELLYALANESKYKNREWTFKKADGSIMDGLVSVTVIFFEGKPTKYLVAATNISHIKFIQAQLKQKNEELEQFAYIAAHDMKEPLRGITTYLSMLQKKYSDRLDEKANLYINNAYDNANRMKTLITDILDFSKTGVVGDQPVNLNNLLDSIIYNYQADVNTNAIISRSKMPILKGDASSFIQLFTNLINNGIKYQPKGQTPEIKIEVAESEKWWAFTVADNGIGIAPEHQNRVFEIFKRLHTESEYTGTGIGLANCKKIVAAYGGKIWFEPVASRGTIFKFTIPK